MNHEARNFVFSMFDLEKSTFVLKRSNSTSKVEIRPMLEKF